MKRAKNSLTLDEVKHRVRYDPATGLFSWNNPPDHSQVRPNSIGNKVNGYWQISINGARVLAHRLAWFYMLGEWPAGHIDHINGARDDNRFSNLRVADYSINAQNRHAAYSNSVSGVLGAKWHKKQRKYLSSIRVNGRAIHLGTFDTSEQAQAAYLAAKAKHHPGFVPPIKRMERAQ